MTRTVTTLPCVEKNVGSGNWDTTRTTIDRIVIHTMVGTAASAASRFYNSASGVSAHYGILLDGSIWHWVDEDNTAYHAGNYAMNQRSIGIEHEDNGDFNGIRSEALYTTSAKLVKDICTFYSIPIDRAHILKHSEVTATGCPDSLDIERIVKEAGGNPSTTLQTQLDACRIDRDGNHNDRMALYEELGFTGLFNRVVAVEKIKMLMSMEQQVKAKDDQLKIAQDTITKLQNEALAKETELKTLRDEISSTTDEWSKKVNAAVSENQRLQKALQEAQQATQPVVYTGIKKWIYETFLR